MMNLPVIGILILSAAVLRAENWPQWRGEGAKGVATGTAPVKLSPPENLEWKVELPGRGCSTPVVWGGRIIVTCGIDGADGVLAFGWDGKEQWRKTFDAEAVTRHQRAGSASNPSALTDGRHVFVYYKSGTLAALTLDGELVWRKNLQKSYAPDGLKWDLGTSPVLAGGNLVVAVMHNTHPSFLLAFDKATGKEVWKVLRDLPAPEEANDAYTTPLVEQIDGVETIVCWGADHLSGHDAKTGKELWRHGDFNPKQQANWRVIASAAATEGIAIVPFGRGGFVAGVKMGGTGETTASHRLWTKPGVGSDSCSPAVRDGRAYVLTDRGRERGTVTCLEAKTGVIRWQTRFAKSVASYFASPTIVGDRIYCAREDGTVFCGTITDQGLRDVVESKLEDTFIASPVAVDGKLLLRGHKFLWCFR